MKTIEIEEDLYRYIASQTRQIGESASDILRRLLLENAEQAPVVLTAKSNAVVTDAPTVVDESQDVEEAPVVHPQTAVPAPEGELFEFLKASGIGELGSKVEVFIGILAALARFNPDAFSKVLELKGRNRVYFATDKEQLVATGSSTNPKQLPETHYWVVTNNNTRKKVAMLIEVAELLHYSRSEALELAGLLDLSIAESMAEN